MSELAVSDVFFIQKDTVCGSTSRDLVASFPVFYKLRKPSRKRVLIGNLIV
ncbi:hypothetical protein XBJ2_1550033 [Xenorhabdus bovienii str. Jollieti]|uniref:Uncharacterized protein n=3 Tax=Xenorhabdus bovienii TaxID=40576 RepID=A0A077QPD3_XENBV|nr:hypothetical protein XBJ1_2858 [Xenorhabdus bovienii SS-2004]CDH07269.1 hypothetical protein XBO1_2630012 [Xenorhabdus bovienii str. oregonense]CDH27812.1 hypothetical protein XBJ2_1550033 [Xenorhabdus bovienii str. Jollieti]CDH35158.1 hypothetical protein XBI1_840068 [Xenorhabdus bovienii str. Intermedium]